MGIAAELGGTSRRFKEHAERLASLLKAHHVSSLKGLASKVREDPEFSNEWRSIWSEIASKDGGKLSLASAGALLGYALGGVGIAALGGAVGVPLFAVLGLGGLVAGTKVDMLRSIRGAKHLLLRIPTPLHSSIARAAAAAGISASDLILQVLHAEFSEERIVDS